MQNEILLNGEVTVEDDRLVVHGESNLIEGTVVTAQLFYNPFNIFKASTKPQKSVQSTVDSNGNFAMELVYSEFSNTDFEERFNGRDLELGLYVDMASGQSNEVKAL